MIKAEMKKSAVHGVRQIGVRGMLIGGMALALGTAACNTEGDSSQPAAPVSEAANVAATSPASSTLVRLTNREYDNAVQELLGVPGVADTTLPTEQTAGVGDDGFSKYFDAADALGEQVWANPLLKSRLLSCTPSEDAACTRQIVTEIGSRAYRGPIAQTDVDRLTKVAMDAVALGETPSDSIKQVVKTVLASPQFLYQVTPASTL
jgi:hypothetical protein